MKDYRDNFHLEIDGYPHTNIFRLLIVSMKPSIENNDKEDQTTVVLENATHERVGNLVGNMIEDYLNRHLWKD